MDIFDVAVSNLEALTQASVPTDQPQFLQVGTQPVHSKNASVPPHDLSSTRLFQVYRTVTPHALHLHCFCKGGECPCHALQTCTATSGNRLCAAMRHLHHGLCALIAIQASVHHMHTFKYANESAYTKFFCTGIKATDSIQPHFVPVCQLEAHQRYSAELLLEASPKPRHRNSGARLVHRGRC